MEDDDGRILTPTQMAAVWGQFAEVTGHVALLLEGNVDGDTAHAIAILAKHSAIVGSGAKPWIDTVQNGIEMRDYPGTRDATAQLARKIRDIAGKMRGRQRFFLSAGD